MAQGRQEHGNRDKGFGGYKSPGNIYDQESSLIAGKNLVGWKDDIKSWIVNEIDKETIVFADSMGKMLERDRLTTTQIRNVFGEMRKIQMNGFDREKSNFILLRAKLAYATKRQNAKGMDSFYELFCIAYDSIDTTSDDSSLQFNRLLQVMEAVLAYHKYYGGQ